MKFKALLPALGIAALLDWLLTRTLTRVGIFVPKTPAMIVLLQGISQVGLFMSVLATLLAYILLLTSILDAFFHREEGLFGSVLLLWVLLSLAGMWVDAQSWLVVLTRLISVLVLVILGLRIAYKGEYFILPACLALVLVQLYALASAARWEWAQSGGVALVYLGEAGALLSALALWGKCGRSASRTSYLLALLPAGLYLAMMTFNASMTAVLAIWSMGLSLYLPAPFYAMALWLALVALFELMRKHDFRAWGVVLLFCSGFASQLGVQFAYACIALWLLSMPEKRIGKEDISLRHRLMSLFDRSIDDAIDAFLHKRFAKIEQKSEFRSR